MRPETLSVHAGNEADPATGAVAPPIHLATTFRHGPSGERVAGYEYQREGNPTNDRLREALAALEGGETACTFASGMAAMTTLLECLPNGARVLFPDDCYSGLRMLFQEFLPERGIVAEVVDMADLEAIRAACATPVAMLWIETPSNPLMKISDIASLAGIGHAAGAVVVVDNTFATPWIQRPLELGFDFVVHSTTKYLNGHSDIIGGVAIASGASHNAENAERLAFLHNAVGAIASPFDSYLVLRGLKTLNVRMQRHCENALELAGWLEAQAGVRRVTYPGLPSHPQHALARRQMHGFGGMIALELDTDLAGSRRFLEACELFTLAESLGGVESLIEHPAIMTHATIPPEQRARLGIGDSLLRLSVGIEEVGDLKGDLDRAFGTLVRG